MAVNKQTASAASAGTMSEEPMYRQLKNAQELVGKTITSIQQHGEVIIAFSDKTMAIFITQEGYDHEQSVIIKEDDVDAITFNLMKLVTADVATKEEVNQIYEEGQRIYYAKQNAQDRWVYERLKKKFEG